MCPHGASGSGCLRGRGEPAMTDHSVCCESRRTDHRARPDITHHKMGRRHEAVSTCSCGVCFSKWGDSKPEAMARAKTAVEDHVLREKWIAHG